MKFTLTHNFPEVQRSLDGLRRDIAKAATASALNKVVAQAKTAMSKEIRAEFVLPASTVSQSLRVSRARAASGTLGLHVVLSSISKPGKRGLNLIHFKPKKTPKGMSFQVRKTGQRKVIKGAFIGNDGRTVFVRTGAAKRTMTAGRSMGSSKEPIKALTTVDLPGMFKTKRINTRVLAMINAKLPAIFANEVRFFTDRFNASGKV